MSELTYKKIVDVEQVETLNDAATVFVNDGGAMKQVAADKFGAVKTVNGVAPDEDGDIKSDIAVPVLITHLKFPMFDDIKCNKTYEELHHSFLTQSTEATSIALCLYTALDKSEEYRYCTNFVLEKDNGEFTKRYFLYFGEDVAPYIIDVDANTITLDPNWIKPEENVQPDWNQNDPNAADYVKNRTHWVEQGLVEIVPETSFETADMDGLFVAELPIMPVTEEEMLTDSIAPGDVRTVVFDGVEYETALSFDNGPHFGNLCVIPENDKFADDTGEPFLWMIDADSMTSLVTTRDTDPTTHTIACYKKEETVHTIDPKFLPAGPSTKLLIITTSTSSMTASANLSYDEIKTALDNGDSIVGCEIQLGDNTINCNNINGVGMYEDHITVMCKLYYNFYSDGRIEIID